MCVGCASSPVPDEHARVGGTACANDAEKAKGGLGLGMQACLLGTVDNGVLDSAPKKARPFIDCRMQSALCNLRWH